VRKVALLAVLVAAACAAVLGGASASTAGNHTVYTDPAGDAQHASNTNYAADIQQIDVTTKDNGLLTFAVKLQDADAKLVQGDQLSIYIDIDRNASTGDTNGFEYQFIADGSSTGTTFTFCTLLAPRSCREWTSAHDTPTSSNTHVVDFSISTDAAAFDFVVLEAYTAPNQTGTLYDVAPDTGAYTFETKTDPDGDGLYGSADRCPTVRAKGKYDKNKNGCPGPFPVIGTNDVHFKGVAYQSYLQVQRVWVSGLPAGAAAVFRMPGVRFSGTSGSSGIAGFYYKRAGANLRYGSSFTVQVTKPAYVGVFLRGKVTKTGLKVTSRSCMKPTGGGPVACTSALKGS